MYTIAINAYTTRKQPATREKKLNPYPDLLKPIPVEAGTGWSRCTPGLPMTITI